MVRIPIPVKSAFLKIRDLFSILSKSPESYLSPPESEVLEASRNLGPLGKVVQNLYYQNLDYEGFSRLRSESDVPILGIPGISQIPPFIPNPTARTLEEGRAALSYMIRKNLERVDIEDYHGLPGVLKSVVDLSRVYAESF